MSDRFGGDRIMLAATVVWSLATIAIPPVVRCFSHPVSWSLILLRIIHGASQGEFYSEFAKSCRDVFLLQENLTKV